MSKTFESKEDLQQKLKKEHLKRLVSCKSSLVVDKQEVWRH